MRDTVPTENETGADAFRLPDDAHVGRVRLRVAELERSLRLYRDVLGLVPVREEGSVLALGTPDGVGADAREGEGAGRELVILEEVPGIVRRSPRPTTTGLYHVALRVPSRRALARTVAQLAATRYPLRGMSDHAVSESLYLDDPDGNGLEIYADRPRAVWPFRGGEVQMTVDPLDFDGLLAELGEDAGPWLGLPSGSDVGHVHFTVSDLAAAEAFYAGRLGFGVMARIPSLTAVSAGGYHHHLNLNTWAGHGAPREPDGVAGLAEWELVVPGAAARERLRERLGGSRAEDPDGIRVSLVG
ncbi:MAG: VOC family protein [Gemmatimonadetes bacterium]|nr:VOC family protein [Gemmatimonadota bacterium]